MFISNAAERERWKHANNYNNETSVYLNCQKVHTLTQFCKLVCSILMCRDFYSGNIMDEIKARLPAIMNEARMFVTSSVQQEAAAAANLGTSGKFDIAIMNYIVFSRVILSHSKIFFSIN